jgi:hypothetical protein
MNRVVLAGHSHQLRLKSGLGLFALGKGALIDDKGFEPVRIFNLLRGVPSARPFWPPDFRVSPCLDYLR